VITDSWLYRQTWGRGAAVLHDRVVAAAEEAGLAAKRAEVLAPAAGRVLEIGSGTGLNLERYPEGLGELVLSEPDPFMVARLRRRLEADGREDVEVVQAPGERLPFGDASFDTVALTLVLCTAPDPEAVVGEIARVLRPGGRFLFLEHVRSADPQRARRQDRLEPVWRFFANGCRCNRATLSTLERSPLEVERAERWTVPKAPPIVREAIAGAAVKPA
jgi:ubiquinone/menaquinone biosynthesis C-methylase UbiE